MAVRVQVPPSAPYNRGAMTLSYCSPLFFSLPEKLNIRVSVSFWYQNVRISAAIRPELVRPGIIIDAIDRGGDQ